MMDRATFEMRVREVVAQLAAQPDLPFTDIVIVLRALNHSLDHHRAQEALCEHLGREHC